MSWITDIFKPKEGKYTPREKEINRLNEEIKSRIKIRTKFNNITVDFNFPEQFVELTNVFCVGKIEWRRYRIDLVRGIFSADNKWAAGSKIAPHKHEDCNETIQSVHGEGVCTLYDTRGNIIKEVRIKEGDSYTIPAGLIHSVKCEDEWDLIVKFKKIK